MVFVVTVAVAALLRSLGLALLLPMLPLVPLIVIFIVRFNAMREQQRRMRCPRCELRLSYRALGPSHGMLECPALCGYRKYVGNPRAGR